MATLADTLDAIREDRDAKRDPELTAVMRRATAGLEASGITDRIAQVGDDAPLFARPNLASKTVRLSDLLKRGPVILSFFRGRW